MEVNDENYAALAVAIFAKVPPEAAFMMLDQGPNIRRTDITDRDVLHMIRMREKKIPYAVIGKIYGLNKHNTFGAIRRYKKRMAGGAANA